MFSSILKGSCYHRTDNKEMKTSSNVITVVPSFMTRIAPASVPLRPTLQMAVMCMPDRLLVERKESVPVEQNKCLSALFLSLYDFTRILNNKLLLYDARACHVPQM